MRLLTLLILLVALVAGCGDDDSGEPPEGGPTAGEETATGEAPGRGGTADESEERSEAAEAEVREAAEAFLEATANGDSQGICDLLARAARAVAEREGGCVTVVERRTTEDHKDRAREAEITTVGIAGNRATVGIDTPGGPGALALIREDGEWRILGDQ